MYTLRQIILKLIFPLFICVLAVNNTWTQTAPILRLESRSPLFQSVQAVEAKDSVLYAASRDVLFIFQIKNNGNLLEIDHLFLNSDITDLRVANDLLYVTADSGLHIFDISIAGTPAKLGLLQGTYFERVYPAHNYIYVLQYSDQKNCRITNIIDIADPTTPQKVGELNIKMNGGLIHGDIKLKDDVGYIATQDSGLYILNTADPIHPIVVNRIDSTKGFGTIDIFDEIMVVSFYDLEWSDSPEYGIEKYQSGFKVFDIGDHYFPTEISSLVWNNFSVVDLHRNGNNIFIVNGTYFLGDCGYLAYGFRSIDPYRPVILDSLDLIFPYYHWQAWPDVRPQEFVIVDSIAYVAQSQFGLRCIHISDPENLLYFSDYSHGYFARNISANENNIVLADWCGGFHIYEKSNPAFPSEKHFLKGNRVITDVAIVSDLVYVLDDSFGLEIYQINDSDTLLRMGRFAGRGRELDIADSLVFIAGEEEGLKIVNVSDPSSPNELALFHPDDRIVTNVESYGSYVFVTYGCLMVEKPGFAVIDISDPKHPHEVYTEDRSGRISALFVYDNLAYIQGDYTDIIIYDISKPETPQKIVDIKIGTSYILDIYVENNLLFLCLPSRLVIYDIADILHPQQIASTNIHGGSMSLIKQGSYIYVAGGYSGLNTFFFDRGTSVNINQTSQQPELVALHPNYPNPFNPSTTIRYDLPQPTFVTLVIYNILGEKVRTLISEFKHAGSYQAHWNGRNERGEMVTSGVYFYQIKTGTFCQIKKMALIQ